jgi:xylan 1,4-beta-xylosidase
VARASGRLRSAAVLLAAVAGGALAPAAGANPVVPGDHPDPSIVRTSSGWYATSTSDDWVPAFPLLHSRDLVHWRQVGSLLASRPSWARNDFWAPELVRGNGGALVYYAALARSGQRCIAVASAARVLGPYRDHGPLLCSRVGEIDPLPVTDEQGARWLIWKRDGNSRGLPTPILAAPLAPGGMSLAAPPRELFRADADWERNNVEAPALARHRGLFYLVYSAGHCCGRNCSYATGVARSPSLLGPWEKRREPILRTDGAIRCPGHAGITRGPGGELELAYHAYVRGDPSNRQLFLAPLRFDVEGWPQVGEPRGAATGPIRSSFEFRAGLGTGWSWPAGLRPRTSVARGLLSLGRGALTRQTGTTRFSATTITNAGDRDARPGLAVTGSEGNAVGIELRGARAIAWRSVAGRRTDMGRVRLPPGRPFVGGSRLVLRIAVGDVVRVALHFRGRWRAVGHAQPPPRWASGARVALTARASPSLPAHFDSLAIRPAGQSG